MPSPTSANSGPTGQVDISYSYDAGGQNPLPPAEVNLDVIYDKTQTAAEAARGAYKVVKVSGGYYGAASLVAPSPFRPIRAVTGLISQHGFDGNDNQIYLSGNETVPTVDKHGLAFKIHLPTMANRNRTLRVDLRSAGVQDGKLTYAQDSMFGGSMTSHRNEPVHPVVTPVVCFAPGTRILTPRGEVAVEALAVGDLVVIVSGAARPIRWLGHRTIDASRYPRPLEIMPVRIAAHAFGPQRPARDLVVSPGHALYFDAMGEVLIPAAALIDGSTVKQISVDEVTYWHVELEAHDILFAENLPAESYLEMGNRSFFAESGTVALHTRPDAPVATHADFCRPYVDAGPRLEAVRAMLREREARAGMLREVVAAA